MQDLEKYKKKECIEIHSRYVSALVVGSIMLVGLVFALGVLMGARHQSSSSAPCGEADLLGELSQQSGEPAVPERIDAVTFHKTLTEKRNNVPVPASLKSYDTGKPEIEGEDLPESEELERVHVQQPAGDEDPVPEKIRDDEADVFTLQVGTFKDQREASLLQQRLNRAGHKSFLVRVNMPDRGGIWYRVRVGPFNNKKAAWDYKEQFESKEGLPAFVVKRRHG